jgi:hypothetical protein
LGLVLAQSIQKVREVLLGISTGVDCSCRATAGIPSQPFALKGASDSFGTSGVAGKSGRSTSANFDLWSNTLHCSVLLSPSGIPKRLLKEVEILFFFVFESQRSCGATAPKAHLRPAANLNKGLATQRSSETYYAPQADFVYAERAVHSFASPSSSSPQKFCGLSLY